MTLQQQVKTVEKQVKKELKGLKKKTTPNDKPKGKKAPSGFAKPSKVTKEIKKAIKLIKASSDELGSFNRGDFYEIMFVNVSLMVRSN